MKNNFFSSSKKRNQSQCQPPVQDDVLLVSSSNHDNVENQSHVGKTTTTPSILWSAILRNDTVLVEADLGGSALNKQIQQAAQLLLKKPPTPGWEHSTTNNKYRIQSTDNNKNVGEMSSSSSVVQDSIDKLKGMKFHVYEHFPEEDDDENDNSNNKEKDAGYGDEWVNYPSSSVPQVQRRRRRYKNDGLTIWTYACVYNPKLVDFIQVQSFLEKIVTMTEIFRQPVVRMEGETKYEPWYEHQTFNNNNNHRHHPYSHSNHALSKPQQQCPQDVWRYGSHHAAQSTFAPILLQRMEEVSYYGKLAMCHAKVDAVKEIMSRNIDLILENEERLAVMANEKAAKLNEMAKVFAKNSKKVKRQMLWNNAKYGAIMGAAITAGVATAVVPVVVLL